MLERRSIISRGANEHLQLAERRVPLANDIVATTSTTTASTGFSAEAPPPPPPPPPPPGSAFPVPMTVAGIRNRAGPGVASATDSFLISARASLKPTAPPAEAPINAMPRTRRARQPTVNVPSDKMAAFLEEMKNAKLKKTNTPVAPRVTAPIRIGGGPRRRADLDVGNITISGESSRDILLELARTKSRPISLKRRREDDSSAEPETHPAKRLVRDAPSFALSDSSQSSVASTVSVTTSFESRSAESGSSTFFNRTWPSTATNETDITTPSLCSDNDNEGDVSPGLNLPPTPPGPSQEEGPPRTQTPETDDHENSQEYSVAIRDSSSPIARVPTPRVRIEQPQPVVAGSKTREIDLLAIRRRVPSSPMPSSTPKKPLPPARTRVVSKSQFPEYISSDEDDDALDESLSPSLPELKALPQVAPAPSRIPRKAAEKKPASQRPSREPSVTSTSRADPAPQPAPPASSNQVKRRKTLDEELRRAGDKLWDADVEDEDDGLEHGLLVGVGSKNKRKGFLSGGGAGGIPVFMGPGYVEGAEDDDDVPGHRDRSRSSSRSRR